MIHITIPQNFIVRLPVLILFIYIYNIFIKIFIKCFNCVSTFRFYIYLFRSQSRCSTSKLTENFGPLCRRPPIGIVFGKCLPGPERVQNHFINGQLVRLTGFPGVTPRDPVPRGLTDNQSNHTKSKTHRTR